MKAAKIERAVLGMPTAKRARLVRKILLSLEDLPQAELDKLWLDEAERRAADTDQGKTKLVSAAEVARKARALLE
jgi:putative addiction module component (TIGR02574 family)